MNTQSKNQQRRVFLDPPYVPQRHLQNVCGHNILRKPIKIIIPFDYHHATYLENFLESMDHCDDIAHCSDLFARKKMSHFNNTHQISPGQAYALELIPVLKTVYIKDIMRMFARKRDIFLAGYHALVLAYQLAPEVFMAGKNIHTISLATCIPCDSFGNRRSAYVIKDPVEKTFNFKTIPIKKSMYKGEYILMFRLIAE